MCVADTLNRANEKRYQTLEKVFHPTSKHRLRSWLNIKEKNSVVPRFYNPLVSVVTCQGNSDCQQFLFAGTPPSVRNNGVSGRNSKVCAKRDLSVAAKYAFTAS